MSTTFWHYQQYELTGATHPAVTWKAIRLNREQIQEAATCPHLWIFVHQCRSPFHQPFMSRLDTLELWQELHLRKRQQLSKLPCLSTCLYAPISIVVLSPPLALAQCGTRGLTSLTTSAAAPQLCPLQLLFPNCVFNCSFPIASASAASPRLCLLLLLLPDYIDFTCSMLFPDYICLWSCTCNTSTYGSHPSPVPRTSCFRNVMMYVLWKKILLTCFCDQTLQLVIFITILLWLLP